MTSERARFLTSATTPLSPQFYLASPYTAPTAEAEEDYREASRQAGVTLRRNGYVVYCPLLADGDTANGWYHYDLAHLRDCRGGLLALKLPGWEHSFGMQIEIAATLALERPVKLLEPSQFVDRNLLERIEKRMTLTGAVRHDDGSVVPHSAITARFQSGHSIESICDDLKIASQEVETALRNALNVMTAPGAGQTPTLHTRAGG